LGDFFFKNNPAIFSTLTVLPRQYLPGENHLPHKTIVNTSVFQLARWMLNTVTTVKYLSQITKKIRCCAIGLLLAGTCFAAFSSFATQSLTLAWDPSASPTVAGYKIYYWAASGSVTGAGARGGFVVDLQWRDGKPTEARIRSVGGRTTTVAYGGTSRTVTLKPGGSVTLKDLAR